MYPSLDEDIESIWYLSDLMDVSLVKHRSKMEMSVVRDRSRIDLPLIRRPEASSPNFRNSDELRIGYDVVLSFGRGGLHFGPPATLSVCRRFVRTGNIGGVAPEVVEGNRLYALNNEPWSDRSVQRHCPIIFQLRHWIPINWRDTDRIHKSDGVQSDKPTSIRRSFRSKTALPLPSEALGIEESKSGGVSIVILTVFQPVERIHDLQVGPLIGSPGGAKPFPGLENLPRSFWHELSSPFTEVYEVESFATETGGIPEPRPFFEDPESNITVQLGAQVHMHCRVQNLQDTLKVEITLSSEQLRIWAMMSLSSVLIIPGYDCYPLVKSL
ncbi:hypothetical protein WN55_10058 [Dufourea novaeangliae]|uniref:Ig-like domain-containing protein n=1 Tax=Dufourea novaeangliae TaxID=178035 RepID=A0A154P8K4_DUFNO|nr:hypothetical protein WN55_10058 [Dufourea novaeangliae]